jgi:hypothetical protein
VIVAEGQWTPDSRSGESEIDNGPAGAKSSQDRADQKPYAGYQIAGERESYYMDCTTSAAAESLLLRCRHGHAAPLVDRLQDRLRDRDGPHAVLAVWEQAALAA